MALIKGLLAWSKDERRDLVAALSTDDLALLRDLAHLREYGRAFAMYGSQFETTRAEIRAMVAADNGRLRRAARALDAATAELAGLRTALYRDIVDDALGADWPAQINRWLGPIRAMSSRPPVRGRRGRRTGYARQVAEDMLRVLLRHGVRLRQGQSVTVLRVILNSAGAGDVDHLGLVKAATKSRR